MRRLTFFLLIVLFLACKKENNQSIVGDWQAIETFNDLANGVRCECWQPVPEPHTLKFRQDGIFEMTRTPFNYVLVNCSGKYSYTDSLLTYQCSAYETNILAKLEGPYLILEVEVYGVKVKTKYRRLLKL